MRGHKNYRANQAIPSTHLTTSLYTTSVPLPKIKATAIYKFLDLGDLALTRDPRALYKPPGR